MTIKTITIIAAAAALTLGLAACGSTTTTTDWDTTAPTTTGNTYEDTDWYGEGSQVDGEITDFAFDAGWDILTPAEKEEVCDMWNDPSFTQQELIDLFNEGAGGMFNDADITAFFNQKC